MEGLASSEAAITGSASRAASRNAVTLAVPTASSPPTVAKMMPSAEVVMLNMRTRSARASPASASRWCSASASQGDIAANWALTQLGKPYQWGAAGPATYDCSGLTMVAWAHAGVQLLHYTGYQWQEGPHVPLNQLRRGDLLFFATNTADPSTIHHVGIYIGSGMMVDAPFTGAFVRIDSMYQPGGLIGAVRPAG